MRTLFDSLRPLLLACGEKRFLHDITRCPQFTAPVKIGGLFYILSMDESGEVTWKTTVQSKSRQNGA